MGELRQRIATEVRQSWSGARMLRDGDVFVAPPVREGGATAALIDLAADKAVECVREALAPLYAHHRPSDERREGWAPYCRGCWEDSGMDGAPTWPCPTLNLIEEALK